VARSAPPRRRRAVGKERKWGAGRAEVEEEEVLAAAWRPVEERRSAAMAAALAGAGVLDEMREASSAPKWGQRLWPWQRHGAEDEMDGSDHGNRRADLFARN
jgi:hypothetical protein